MFSIFLSVFVVMTYFMVIYCFNLSKKQMIIAWGITTFLQGLIAVSLCASITPFMLTACKGSDEKKSDSVPARRIQ